MRLFSWGKIISNFSIFVKIFYSKAGVESNTFNFKKAIVAFPLQSGTGPVFLLP